LVLVFGNEAAGFVFVGSGTVDVGDAGGCCCWFVFDCLVFESLFRKESEVTEPLLALLPLSVMLFSFDLKKLGDEDRLELAELVELGEGGTTL
jgi:hypothetical protein